MADEVASPCNSVCKVDPVSGWCIGCFRTLAEISEWPKANRDDRQSIAARARARLGGQAQVTPCENCRTVFSCGGGSACWCEALRASMPPDSAPYCLCPMCLRVATL